MVRRWRGPEKQRGSGGVAGLATVKARESNRGPPRNRRADGPRRPAGWRRRESPWRGKQSRKDFFFPLDNSQSAISV